MALKLNKEIFLPSEDDLPESDGEPMETENHILQFQLLIDFFKSYYQGQRVYANGNMFVYFSKDQLKNKDFKGPDFFIVLDVDPRLRKSWVVWQEGKGPDVVIELTSESTAKIDKVDKKLVYQDKLRVPEYILFDPISKELSGFELVDGKYRDIEKDEKGRIISQRLNLFFTLWEGEFLGVHDIWLRCHSLDDLLIPSSAEKERHIADKEHRRANMEHQRAESERQRAENERQRAESERQRAEKLSEQLKKLGINPDEI
ncbi:MAG: Uma2 family endonuclease [Spirochaetota bacterium]|nr:Uma2 family endonuclease [Spirochaetota bacterium]